MKRNLKIFAAIAVAAIAGVALAGGSFSKS